MRHTCLIAFLSLFLFTSCSDSESGAKPNILFIAVDDLRPELACFGEDHIHSPNIDKLAEESLLFTRAYCNVPTCGASRASLLAGLRPGRHRFVTYDTRKDAQVPEVVSLPMHFKHQGYTTISNGKVFHHMDDDSLAWHEIWRPEGNIRDYLIPENQQLNSGGSRGRAYECVDVNDEAYFDGKIASKGIVDLGKLKKKGEPFFLAIGFMKPHLPFNAPQKYWDLYNREEISLPENYCQSGSIPNRAFHKYGELRSYTGIPQSGHLDEELATELIRGYYACVSYVDAQIGRVLDELQRLNLDENTIVVLWGDHGWNLGEHMLWCKHCTFETSLRAPLIVKVPGKTEGSQTNTITEFIDIYPSLCDLSGIEKPMHLEGESFVPLIHEGWREKNYAVAKFRDAVTLIKGDLFYTEWTDDEGSASARMLFDHSADPLELDNLAEQEAYKDIVAQLALELREKWGSNYLD